MSLAKINVYLTPGYGSWVKVDEKMLPMKGVRSIEVEHRAGETPLVRVTYIGDVHVEGQAEVNDNRQQVS